MAREVPKDIGLVELIRNANPTYNRYDWGDMDALEKEIAANGIQVPILIRSDYQIIDGARRFRAALALGWDWVPTKITDDFYTAITAIAAARDHGLLEKRLGWLELDNLVRYTLVPLYAPIKGENMSAALREGPSKRGSHGSPLTDAVADLFGVIPSQIEAMRRLGAMVSATRKGPLRDYMLNVIKETQPPADKPWAKGINSAMAACEKARANWTNTGSIQPPKPEFLDATEQASRLANLCRMLEGVVREMRDLGPINPDFPKDQVSAAKKALYATSSAAGKLRTQLSSLIQEG